ncbi:hypothetical protein OG21DRAFT_1213207 [Imleria badia]|nr:hypothetical protein OG21DRAFT_1213207 [Imleria badia]
MTAQSTTTPALLYHHVLSIVIVLRQVTRLDWLSRARFWNLIAFQSVHFSLCSEPLPMWTCPMTWIVPSICLAGTTRTRMQRDRDKGTVISARRCRRHGRPMSDTHMSHPHGGHASRRKEAAASITDRTKVLSIKPFQRTCATSSIEAGEGASYTATDRRDRWRVVCASNGDTTQSRWKGVWTRLCAPRHVMPTHVKELDEVADVGDVHVCLRVRHKQPTVFF